MRSCRCNSLNRTSSSIIRGIHTSARSPSLQHLSLPELDAHKQSVSRSIRANSLDKSSQELLQHLDAVRGQKFIEKGAVLEARQAFLEQIRVNDALSREYCLADSASTISAVSRSCWESIHAIEHEWKAYFALPQEIEDAEGHFALVYHGVYRHTMLHWARLLNIWRAIRSIGMEKAALRENCESPTDPFVLTECGVAGGGCSVLMAVASKLYLTDSWGGHSLAPQVISIDNFIGMPMENLNRDKRVVDGASPLECGWGEGTCGSIGHTVSLDSLAIRFGVQSVIRPVKGDFHDVLPKVFPEKEIQGSTQAISFPKSPRVLFAHIDADWYDSTAVCLRHVYPNIVGGGIGGTQIDDFHYWDGCRKAVHDYFQHCTGKPPTYERIPYDENAVYIAKA